MSQVIPSLVLYVVSRDGDIPVTVPAAVTRINPASEGMMPTLNLQVFVDGRNGLAQGFSDDDCAQGLCWKGTVSHGDEVGCWMFEEIAVDELPPEPGDTDLSVIGEQLVRRAVEAYQDSDVDHEESITAAAHAVADLQQYFDLQDGSDDEQEDPARIRPYVALVLAAYSATPGDHELSVRVATAALLTAVAGEQHEDGEEAGPGQPSPGQKNENGSYITASQWFSDRGFDLPGGPGGASVGPEFLWGPNVPNEVDADASTPWVWRPPFPA